MVDLNSILRERRTKLFFPIQFVSELSAARGLVKILKLDPKHIQISYDHQVNKALVQKSGYMGACSALSGWNDEFTNPYVLRRMSFAKSQIRFLALQFSELSKGRLPREENGKIFGLNKKVMKLWEKRYSWLDKILKRDDFLLK